MDKGLASLLEWTWNYRVGRVLHVANGLGVFEALAEGPLDALNLARRTGTDAGMLERLLIACCAMGLLRRSTDRYENTETADRYLVPGRPLYQGDIIAHGASVWSFWDRLESAVREGPRQGPPARDPEQHRRFILGMHNITMAGRGRLFLDHVDLSGRKKLFDVGGGPGTYSILACRKWPELRAVVFDVPETIAIAAERIAADGLADRIRTQVGNWDTDEFGEGNDVVLFSNVLHGAGSSAEHKLAKAYRSLVPGGLVVIQEFLLDDDKNGPLVPALFNVMVGAFSRGELMNLVRGAGFVDVRVVAHDETLGSTWLTALKPPMDADND